VRFREVAAKVRKAEATLFHMRWIEANTDVTDAAHTHDINVREMAERTREQAEAARIQAIRASELPALREGEARAAAGLQRLTNAREQLDREEERARERVTELDRRLQQFAADIAREQQQASDAEIALQRLDTEDAELKEEIKSRVEKRSGVDERVAEAEETLSAAERMFGELTTALADLTARRNQLEAGVRTHRDRLARLDQEIASVQADEQKLSEETGNLGDLDALAGAMETAQETLAVSEAMAQASEAGHVAARQKLEASRAPLTEAEKRVQRLETEARTISKLVNGETKNLWPPIIDGVTVAKGYEKALGAVLGDDLDAPADPSSPMRWAGAAVDAADPTLPEGAEPLSQHVTAPAELARRLAQIGVISRADATQLVPLLKPGQRLVSRDGDLWRWDGFAADAHAPTGAARRLAERGRLSEIDAELSVARAEVETKRATVEAANAAAVAAASAESAAREQWRTAQHDADAARELHAAAEREIARNTARISALNEAKTRLTTGRDEARTGQQEAESSLAALAPSAEIEERLAQVRIDIETRRSDAAQVRAEAQALAREAELADRRLNAIATDRQQWSERRDGARNQIATLEARSQETGAERESLAGAPAMFAEKRQALISEIEKAEEAKREAADRLAEAESVLGGHERAVRAALEALGTAREEAATATERLEGAKRRLSDIAHEIKEMLEVEPEGVAAMAGIEAETVLPDVPTIEAELDKLRRDRERIGAVNLRAEEELREVEAQHVKLTAERDDLVQAIARLRQGIISLNKEARERLLTSFTTVNTHFQRLFTELFGGGSAELQLIEHDDPLEAGLEIFAKPPGKKPATLSLLSGGEQALTAMALIFAVFLTNPAPICVLDEVDAPLDDHNVERFCDLLDEMTRSTDTRFVIITHNPITMARMNRLFGVTMAERGISQLVSVDLEAAVRIREAS